MPTGNVCARLFHMAKLLNEIRKAIRASDESPYAIAKGAGVARSALSRLLSGERGLSVDAAERLADYLGLTIIVRPRQRKGR